MSGKFFPIELLTSEVSESGTEMGCSSSDVFSDEIDVVELSMAR